MADLAKVKRNIARMIEQNAPETDIDAYVASEGTTPEELRGASGAGSVGVSQQQAPQQTAQAAPQSKPGIMQQIGEAAFGITPLGMTQNAAWAYNNPGQALQKADDSVRMLANGATFGYADKIAGYLNGDGKEAEREKSAAAKDRLGVTGDALEIGGSMLPATRMAQLGVTATKLPGYLGKFGGMALDGAGYGALTAAGNDTDISTGALMGAAGGILGQGAGAVANKGKKLIEQLIKGKPKPQSLDELAAQKNAAYQAVDNAGEQYSPEQVKTLVSGVEDDLSASGIDSQLNPLPFRFSEILKSKSENPMTLRELDKIDAKIGRKLLTSNDGEDRYLGGIMRDNISEFMDANGGSELINAARGANKKFRNLERVLQQTDKAERRAASTGSGGNEDNAIRQNIRAILDNKKTSKFYNDQEKEAMKKVVSGTAPQNLARRVGKMSPENGGLMAALSTFGSIANPLVGVPAAAGFVSKRIADKATKNNLDELIYLLSRGEKMPRPKGINKDTKDLLARLLMGGAVGATQ